MLKRILPGVLKTISAILICITAAAACTQRDMSLEDLEKAQWDSVATGIYYISTGNKKGIAVQSDSLQLKLKGISGKDVSLFEMSLKELPVAIRTSIKSIVDQKLPDSKSGYLKINLSELLRPDVLVLTVYMDSDPYYDSVSYPLDSAVLESLVEVASVDYISKEEAKKEYIAETNEDWDRVLDANPLPACFRITLEQKYWTEELLTNLKNEILSKITLASDITYPAGFLKKSDDYLFFEYTRK